MTKLSLLDKLKIFFEVSKSSKLFIAIIVFLIFFSYILLTTNKKNKKTSKTFFILIYLFIFLFVVITYHASLGKMFDYLMNNLFIIIYFPNLAVYFAAIIITNIIILFSIFNFKTTKLIKNINIFVYGLLNYLLALLLNVIITKKLDIFTIQSVYSNKQALGLIELSSNIFILWLIFLIVYKVFLTYLKKNSKNKNAVKQKKPTIMDNIKETTLPANVKIINNKPKDDNYDNILTLNDYKLLLEILKENKEKTNKEASLENKLNKALNKNYYTEPKIIKTKEITQEEIYNDAFLKEQSIFEELQKLYNIK